MKRETLLDFLDDRIRSDSPFLVHDDGLRTITYTYDDVRRAAVAFAGRLESAGVGAQEKVVLWGENRPEWVAALWGCWLQRAVAVPIDYRASAALLTRIVSIVKAHVVMTGAEVAAPALPSHVSVWPLDGVMAPPGREDHPTGGAVALPAGTAEANAQELAEIIFTSGATAEPKGVQLTHHNILANIIPVEREIDKYRRYARPFSPLRFLNLLPLSHMFGQAMATFIPPMLAGTTVFMRGFNPTDIIHQIHTRRVSVLVCVPKILEVLREHLLHLDPTLAEAPARQRHVALRWWEYRRVHGMFGLKFWAFVVGAAPLDPALEAFWSRLGFLVVQGYGLTETAPIVTLNHPFRARQGTVGTPIGGVEVKVAPDGEILVRGENVTSGYYNAPEETAAAFKDGWFHTGDIGALDASGRLAVLGRKKDVIVTPEGLNVFPADVERVLMPLPGVRDAAVVGAKRNGREHVHAVLLVSQDTDTAAVIRMANGQLEEHQKIRGCSVWPGEALPRTEGTQKLKRRELRQWVEAGEGPLASAAPSPQSSVEAVVQRFAPDRQVASTTTLDELGLSSIERIELTMALEQAFDRTIDEAALSGASTVADLRSLLTDADRDTDGTRAPQAAPAAPASFPTWNRSWPARVIRQLSLAVFLIPLTRLFAWIHVEGLEHLTHAPDPVVYAANHQSHLDGPVLLAALPSGRRYRVAIAAAKEFFSAHFHPERHTGRERFTSNLNYYLASLLFHVFPLPQRETGTRDALRYVGELVGAGTSILIFPEGRRSKTGEVDVFQPGIGMIAARLRVTIIPVRLEGLDRILHHSWRMARPGRARVAFGAPLRFNDGDYRDLARRVEEAVRAL